MAKPAATYRLQLRQGMTFARASELAPYFERLGISHVYLSPIFRAMPGSTHGYDAVRFNEIDPALGGEAGFRELAARLKAHGLGIVLDFVPNHMSASALNPWWSDVLEWGAQSAYARHFDVDWSAEKLLVPALGRPYGEALARGEIRVCYGGPETPFSVTYQALSLPLTPPSYAVVLAGVGDGELLELARRFAISTAATAGELKVELEQFLRNDEIAVAAERAVAALSEDTAALHLLLEAQVWRLALWRTSRESLTYRRFFEISDLVGVRVEVPQVFDDVHRQTLGLIEEGLVDGLRIDHLDGLADPLAYLKRLRAQIGRDDFYLIVEKILGHGEDIRPEWPVDGSTGYEFIRDLSLVLVDPSGREPLTHAYEHFVGRERDFSAEALATKRRTFTRNLAGELEHLTTVAYQLAQADIATRDLGRDTLRRAIVELASALPVYRTYIDAAGPRHEDLDLLRAAGEAAQSTREVEDEAAIRFLVRLLALDVGAPERQAEALAFTMRFQQTTGPLMAKALEDTLFYRYNRLIALNEVGGEPQHFGAPHSLFHAGMRHRLERSPGALSATATHDTKRGEDARARIYAISEMPEAWAQAVARWSGITHDLGLHARMADGLFPEPDIEWMFYQALLGVWPWTLSTDDAAGRKALAERMAAFMLKAVREAKLHTSWTQQNEAYEQALENFVRRSLACDALLDDFVGVAKPLMVAGALTSLAQIAIKLCAPGVPDIYQGTEFWDLSLVDPDNRRAVDYASREAELERERGVVALINEWHTGALKLRLIKAGLAFRRSVGPNIATADYVPLEAVGPQAGRVLAFARAFEDRAAIVVVPRLALGLLAGEELPKVPLERWRGTAIKVPHGMRAGALKDAITGYVPDREAHIDIEEALSGFPVALLVG